MPTPHDRIFLRQALRDTLATIGIAPEQEGALIFIALMVMLFPFTKYLIQQGIGDLFSRQHELIVDSLSGILTLGVVFIIAFVYKWVRSERSLMSVGAGKLKLGEDEKREMGEYLSVYAGRHVEVHYSHIERQFLALELSEQFAAAGWNVSSVDGFYIANEHQNGVWVVGRDDQATEAIVIVALEKAFIPCKFDPGEFNRGIKVFIGRPPSV